MVNTRPQIKFLIAAFAAVFTLSGVQAQTGSGYFNQAEEPV